jgi:Na+/phosphate symporter
MLDSKQLKPDLTLHWVYTGMMVCMLIAFNIICYLFINTDIQINLAEEQRIVIRTVFYVITIILFPLVNLLRHIMLRLNQTMPGDNPAKYRYLVTIIITMAVIEFIGIMGLVMYILGDGVNSLYIFSVLGALGIFLHRPRIKEYRQIVEARRVQDL